MSQATAEGQVLPTTSLAGEVRGASEIKVVVEVQTTQIDGTTRTDFILSDAARKSLNTGSGSF